MWTSTDENLIETVASSSRTFPTLMAASWDEQDHVIEETKYTSWDTKEQSGVDCPARVNSGWSGIPWT